MKKVKGIKSILEISPDFKWSDLVKVKRIEFLVDAENKCNLNFSILTENLKMDFQVDFSFSGVLNLVINEIGGGEVRVLGLDIVDVSQNQLEGINYDVFDYENNIFKFSAEDVEITAIRVLG